MGINRTDKQTAASRQQVYFSDFLTNMTAHPITGNLAKVTNSNSIKQALKTVILTNYGERPYQPLLGGNVKGALFGLDDPFEQLELKKSIEQTIFNNDPRISGLTVVVSSDPDNNKINVSVTYQIQILKTVDSFTLSLVPNR